MRSLDELIDPQDSGWSLVQDWIANATNPVAMLPADRARAEATLVALQVTTRSPMEAIALRTGGLLVDSGWLRILGSGSDQIPGTLLTWNGRGDGAYPDPLADAVIIAHDAVGGFFALNGGAFEGTTHGVFYFAPDSLHWEDLGFGYSGFIQFALEGDLTKFYENARWPGWREETAMLNGDQGIFVYPPLWAKGDPVPTRHRDVVPMSELWALGRDWARQMKDLPPGTPIRIVVRGEEHRTGD
jgi:hypothetical protein